MKRGELVIPERKFNPDHPCILCGGTFKIRRFTDGKFVPASCDCDEAKEYAVQMAESL